MRTDTSRWSAVWGEADPSDIVHDWLTRHGLNSMPMVVGLLITGSRQQFERAFQVELGGLGSRSSSLPVPDALKPFVCSIEIPRPPTIHIEYPQALFRRSSPDTRSPRRCRSTAPDTWPPTKYVPPFEAFPTTALRTPAYSACSVCVQRCGPCGGPGSRRAARQPLPTVRVLPLPPACCYTSGLSHSRHRVGGQSDVSPLWRRAPASGEEFERVEAHAWVDR